MPTKCSSDLFEFAAVEGRRVVAEFDGGSITSDAGALLLWAWTDRAIKLMDRFAGCFRTCCPELVEHSVATLVGQRIYGIALGYEDLIDHDTLRHDPVFWGVAGKLTARRKDCAPVAGKSTLNRLELSKAEPSRYHNMSYDGLAIETLFVDLFLEAHRVPPKQIILDLDATDDPLHGHQEGRFFMATMTVIVTCRFIFSAAGIFCVRSSGAPTSMLRLALVKRQPGPFPSLRARWPKVRILPRADSGFARDESMSRREENEVDYLFGLAKNNRLIQEIETELAAAAAEGQATGKPARCFKDFTYATLGSRAASEGLSAKQSGFLRVNCKATKREAKPIPGSSSLLSLRLNARRDVFTKSSIARAERWKTASRSASSIFSPTAPRRQPCAPISCGFILPRWPMFSSVRCGALASSIHNLPKLPVARSASGSSRLAHQCAPVCGGSRSPWPPPFLIRRSSAALATPSPKPSAEPKGGRKPRLLLFYRELQNTHRKSR